MKQRHALQEGIAAGLDPLRETDITGRQQLELAREADAEWRKQHRGDLERSIVKIERVYSHLAYWLGVSVWWGIAYGIDRAFFQSQMLFGAGAARETDRIGAVAMFNAVTFTGAILVGSLASSYLTVCVGDRIKSDLATCTDAANAEGSATSSQSCSNSNS